MSGQTMEDYQLERISRILTLEAAIAFRSETVKNVPGFEKIYAAIDAKIKSLELAEKVADIIRAALDLDEAPRPELALVADLGADSLDAVELCLDLEEAFDIAIADEELEAAKTVGDVIALVGRHGRQAA